MVFETRRKKIGTVGRYLPTVLLDTLSTNGSRSKKVENRTVTLSVLPANLKCSKNSRPCVRSTVACVWVCFNEKCDWQRIFKIVPISRSHIYGQGCGSGRIRTFLVGSGAESGKFSPDPENFHRNQILSVRYFGYVKLYKQGKNILK